MPRPFPSISLDHSQYGDSDANPAIRLFGRRFFTDQTPLELLAELLLVATSPKKLNGMCFDTILPPTDILDSCWDAPLRYAPRARLNLKLFAFFGASRLDSRHHTHRAHLEHLDQLLRERMTVSDDTPDNVLKTLENLFLGFHGVGAQRTWCAQTFLPVCCETLACETTWRVRRSSMIEQWDDALDHFAYRQALFFAHGGESLYLQLCNALRKDRETIDSWIDDAALASYVTRDERNPEWLRHELECAIARVLQESPATLWQLADFIDRGVDSQTSVRSDGSADTRRWVSCGWCPEESWQEGYLFAVELLRICRAKLDLMDRLELLETACAAQVLRSLARQSVRYAPRNSNCEWPYYRLGMSDPNGDNSAVKQVSRSSLQAVSKTIFDALRSPEILDGTPIDRREALYAEADRRYGHKLFITVGKRIGLIVPYRGPGARFVLTGQLLRLLLVTLLPNRRITYDTFKQAAEAHFGMAFDEDALRRASQWSSGSAIESFDGPTDDWLAKLLEEAGALRRLSDSCALVENTLSPDESEVVA